MTNTGVAVYRPGMPSPFYLDRIQSKPIQSGRDAKGKPAASWDDRRVRMEGIVQRTAAAVGPGALVFLEAPSYGSTGSGTFDRSGLWWMLYATLDSIGAAVVPVSPSQRMLYATGKGGGKDAGKDAVIAAVVRRYPELEVTDNNVADAVVLLAMARRAAGFPMDQGSVQAGPGYVPAANLKAMDKLDLTPLDSPSSVAS